MKLHATAPDLCLEPAGDADFAWLLGQTPPPRGYSIASGLAPREVLEIIRQLPANWLMIAGSEIVGIISLKADSCDQVEIGYGVASSREGRGFASAAVGALLPMLARRGVAVVVAETSTDNRASQRVLTNNGFVATGERCDNDDGLLIVWRADLTAARTSGVG
jgi:RimJ/RimL family protein N-acetyltransferase